MIGSAQAGLKKHRISTSTVVFMIFCLCAAGAYGIEDMVPQAGPGLTLVMLIVLPFLWSTPMGLVASELGSAIPEEGGFYKWVQRACGEFWGFQAGWWRTISIYVDNTIYVVLAGSYVATVVNLTPAEEYLFKASMVVFFTYINIRGIKDVGIVSTTISILVMIAFALVAAFGFANWQSNPFDPFIPPDQTLVQSVGAGIAIGIWMYSGYESMSTMAGEIEDPQVIPKATLITVPLIMAAYILPTMGGLASLGSWNQWASEDGLSYSDVVANHIPALGILFVLVAVIAQFSVFNAYITSGSRGFFALAEDNLAPKVLVKCSKERGVPYVAVLSLGAFSLIACTFPFEVIVVVDVILFISAYVLIFISACILRIKEPDLERPFKIPLGTMGFIAMCIGIAVGDTIHFMARYRIERNAGRTREDAVEATMMEAGYGIVRTSVILVGGFSVMVISSYQPITTMGILLPTTLVAALVLDLTLVPAMALLGLLDSPQKKNVL